MNDTGNYLLQMRETLAERLAARFLAGLALLVLSCGISFALLSLYTPGGYFLAVNPVERSGFFHTILSLVRSTLPSAVCLLLLYAAAHTVFADAVSIAVLAWRGLCLGCAGRLMSSGSVASIGRFWTLALTLYFVASVLMILLAAYSSLYSLCLCRVHSDGAHRLRSEVAQEYLRLFLILSGGVFAAGCAATLLI
ncbi:MAG: hypothetical protein ACI4V1_03120 [Eubacteriales bacterium]